MSKTVELFPAWEWICLACERNNYASAITMEIATDDPQYDDLGGSDSHGAWMSVPDDVTCKHCNAKFRTGEEHDLGGEGG